MVKNLPCDAATWVDSLAWKLGSHKLQSNLACVLQLCAQQKMPHNPTNIPRAATKTQHNQINKHIFKKCLPNLRLAPFSRSQNERWSELGSQPRVGHLWSLSIGAQRFTSSVEFCVMQAESGMCSWSRWRN